MPYPEEAAWAVSQSLFGSHYPKMGDLNGVGLLLWGTRKGCTSLARFPSLFLRAWGSFLCPPPPIFLHKALLVCL